MTGQQLKNSILQEAIEGRLVPQDPNDEPASVLLERIRAEKARLVKEKKIKKDKNESRIYRTEDGHWMEHFEDKSREDVCIDEEIPFDVPSGWEWCRISNIFLINPKVKSDDNKLAAFIPMEKISACYSSKYDYVIKKWGEIKNGFTCFADGDVAFAKITPCFQNRKSVIFENLPNSIGTGTTELKVLRQYAETINRKYLLYFLKSSYFIEQAKFKGTANQQRIIVGYLENKLFPLPPLAEQRRIVEKIESLLPKVDAYGKAQEELEKLNEVLPEQLKKSILQEAIEGRLVPQDPNDEPASELLERIRAEKTRLVKEKKIKKDKNESRIYRTEDGHWMEHFEDKSREDVCIDDEIPFDVPSGWEWCRFGFLVNTTTGKTPSRGEAKYWSNTSYPWISISDMTQGGVITTTKEYISDIASKECFSNRISPKGTLIMSFKLTVGRTSILGVDAYHNEAIISIETLCDVNNYLRDFLSYILPIISISGDSKNAIKGKTLNSTSIYNLLIPFPPLAEQHRIVEKIESLLPKIEKLKVKK